MAELNYVDIFATKGTEYLLVLGYLAAFILFWQVVKGPKPTVAAVSRGFRAARASWFRLLDKAYYHPGHTWALPEGEDIVRVGIDDFAQKMLGDVDRISAPAVGHRLEQGEKGFELIVDGRPVPLLSPVRGEVLAVNKAVLESPRLLRDDPYGKGWLLKVKVPSARANLRNLLSGRFAMAWMQETVAALRDAMRNTARVGTVLQDGGVPVQGIARALSPEGWDELAKEFFMTK